MIILSYTVVCSDETIANDIAGMMPDFQVILDRPGVSAVNMSWTAEKDRDEP